MAKKLTLSLVDPTATGSKPPRKLGSYGLSLWNAVQSEYVIDDRGGVDTLLQICAAADRVEALAARISEDGEVVRCSKGVIKAHPCLRDELQLRSFICRGLQRLGLNVETIKADGQTSGQIQLDRVG